LRKTTTKGDDGNAKTGNTDRLARNSELMDLKSSWKVFLACGKRARRKARGRTKKRTLNDDGEKRYFGSYFDCMGDLEKGW